MKTSLSAILDPSLHERFYINPGEAVEDNYAVHYDKNGVRHLRKDGKINTFDEIQSHRESCDVEVILKRYAHGDFSVLDRGDPQYLDTTQFPSSFAEWFEQGEKAKRYFLSLAPEVRAQFNNSFEQFLTAEVPAKFEVKEVKSDEP